MTGERYIGDGLYVSWDGFHFKLRAPRGFGNDHEVYLDPGVHAEYLRFAEEVYKTTQLPKKEPE